MPRPEMSKGGLQPNMKFTANSSSVGRILDTLSQNRVTDFDGEGVSPVMRKTISGVSPAFKSFTNKRNGSLKQTQTFVESHKAQSSFNTSLSNSKSQAFRLNPLRMSQPLKGKSSQLRGKDLRPDLHTKTYFKAQQSFKIQNSPRYKLPSTTSKFSKGKTERNFKIQNPFLEQREGRQAYDTQV